MSDHKADSATDPAHDRAPGSAGGSTPGRAGGSASGSAPGSANDRAPGSAGGSTPGRAGGLAKTFALYLAGLKLTLRSIVILLAALLALIAAVLISLPQELFSANEIPKVSLSIVYGDGSEQNELSRNLDMELGGIELVDAVHMVDPQTAAEQLASGEVDAVVTLPEDTLEVLVYGGHATITVESNDAVLGLAVYAVTKNAVETLDELQNYALIYRDAAREHIPNSSERADAVADFNIELISEAFTSTGSVEIPWTVSPYSAQALTLLLFLAVSIAAFFVAVVAARQYASGYIRHLYTRGVRFRHLIAAQLMLSASVALLLGLILAAIFSFVSSGLSVPGLLVSSVLLSVMLTSIYLMFSGLGGQVQVATTRTLLGCLAVMFFFLFAGGGFYPTELMLSDLRLFNPTWLADQLATWSLGGDLDPLQLAMFLLPLGAACAVCYLEWRRAL